MAGGSFRTKTPEPSTEGKAFEGNAERVSSEQCAGRGVCADDIVVVGQACNRAEWANKQYYCDWCCNDQNYKVLCVRDLDLQPDYGR